MYISAIQKRFQLSPEPQVSAKVTVIFFILTKTVFINLKWKFEIIKKKC